MPDGPVPGAHDIPRDDPPLPARLTGPAFGALAGSLSDAVVIAGPDGAILYGNTRAAALFGYEAGELVGRSIESIVPGARRAPPRSTDPNPARPPVLRGVREDGSEFPAEVTSSEAGGLVVAIVRDATDREGTEQRLATREAELDEALRLAQVGSWDWDVGANRIHWSPELYRIFGLAAADLDATYEGFLDRVHPDDRQRVDAVVRGAVEDGGSFEVELRIVRPDASVRILLGRGRAVAGDVPAPRLVGTAQDVTDARRAELAVREREQLFREVFDRAPLGLAIVAPDLTLQRVNEAFCHIVGYTPAELRGRPFGEITHPEDLYVDEQLGKQVFAGEIPGYEIEKRYLHKDGHAVWVKLRATVIRDGSGAPMYGVGLIENVTDRKRTVAALQRALTREREATDRLRQVDAMKDSFLQAVSHELRTPLASVLGFALTLERDDIALDGTQGRRLVGRLAANARKLDGLLTDLLDLDRLMRGVLEPARRPTDVRAIVEATSVDPTGERAVAVEVPGGMTALLDGPKVERIVENLVSNARRHTRRGVPIWVRAWRDDDRLLLAVEDGGPGVPPERRDEIFREFERGDEHPHAPGTGIGLAIVARFAQLHGGRAWVEDRPGGGASFRVSLPGAFP